MPLLVDKPSNKSQFSLFVLIAAMMSMIGIFSSDIYLPSMPYMATYFNVSYSLIQKTISFYLLGLAVFQLIYGPISDHFGRRKTLLIGLLIYIVASIGCVFSAIIPQLLSFRFLQAIGACSGLVMGRTIIADLFDRQEAAHVFSIVLPLITISPILSPVIGGHVQAILGWRFVMAFTVLFGVVLFLLVWLRLGETMNMSERPGFSLKGLWCKHVKLIASGQFILSCLIVGCVYATWFGYLADSAYIYRSFGLTAALIGYCYISQSVSSMVGSITLKRLLKVVSTNIIVGFAVLANLAVCVLMIFFSHLGLWWFLSLITIITFTNGMLLPANISSAMSTAVEINPTLGGTASGLIGFIQIGCAAIGTVIVGLFPNGATSLATILAIIMAIAATIYLYRTLVQRIFKARG